MNKTTFAKAFTYNQLTFGVYNILWLSRTRRTLMARTGLHIPSPIWLVLHFIAQISVIIAVVIAVLNPTSAGWPIFILVVVAAIANQFVYPIWLKNFYVAIEQVSNGRMNQTAAAGLLLATPNIAIPLIEQAISNPESLPKIYGTFDMHQLAVPASIEGNEILKRVLTVVAVVAALFLAFLLAIPALINLQ